MVKGCCIVVICTCLSERLTLETGVYKALRKKITEHLRLYILLGGRPLDGTRGDPPHHQSRLDL